MSVRRIQTDPVVLHAAINDGINEYVRTVLEAKGLIDKERRDSIGQELDKLQHDICVMITDKWKVSLQDPTA